MPNHLYLPAVVDNYASAPDSVALSITGDLDLRWYGAADDWGSNKSLLCKWSQAGNQKAYRFQINAGDDLRLVISEDGAVDSYTADSTVALAATAGISNGDDCHARVTVDVDDGASDAIVTFYYSVEGNLDPDDITWTQLGGTVALGATTSFFDSTALLEVGSHTTGTNQPFDGKVYAAQVYNGIGGTLVFDAVFTDLTVAELEAGTFVEDSSNAATVTLVGDEWAYVRPGNATSILASAELVLMASDGNEGFSPKWADHSGNNHHAQLGSTATGDTNDPLWKGYAGDRYVFLPGTAGNYLSTPDAAAISVTDTFFLAAYVALDDWGPAADTTIIAKSTATGNQRAFVFKVDANGFLELVVSDNGVANETASSAVDVGFTNGTSQWIGANFDGGVVQFFVGGTDISGPTWVQSGTDQTLASHTAVFDSTAVLEVGAFNVGTTQLLAGNVYRAILYDDLTETTTVFDAVLIDAAEPFATFTERSSNAATVTINRSGTALVSTVVDRDMWLFTTDDYFEIADHADLNFAAVDSFTIMAVARDVDVDQNFDCLISKGDFNSTPGYVLFAANFAGRQGRIRDSVPLAPSTDSTFNLADQVLNSSTLVRDVAGDDITCFTDGVAGTPTADSTTASLTTTNALRIGAKGLDATPANHYEGQIHAVALWRSALTDVQILQAHDQLTGAGAAANLLLLGVG